jgi:hypothetical protein
VNKLALIAGGASIVSFAAGVATGYFVFQRKLEAQYEERMKVEIEETKKFYAKLSEKESYKTPADAAAALMPQAVGALKQYQGGDNPGHFFEKVDPAKEFSEEPPSVKSVFDRGESTDTVSEKDKRNRTEEAPYILEREEFLRNDSDYTQSTLTWYAGDGVLTDSRDDIINEVDDTVGQGNLQHFGYGSGDPKVLYVRNDALDIEFEILHHEGTYKKHVAGLD